MEFLVFVVAVVEFSYVSAEIGSGAMMNRLLKVKPVGGAIARNFVPLTEIPPPAAPSTQRTSEDGRRHLDIDPDCIKKPDPQIEHEGGNVNIFGEYYDDRVAKTVATVIIPDHIDYKHFQVTTPVPYLTVGPIEAIGYHPTTHTPNECEKIYQDHMAEQYSDEPTDYSDESLEMARMPLNYDAGKDAADRDSMSVAEEFQHESLKSIRSNKKELERLLEQHDLD